MATAAYRLRPCDWPLFAVMGLLLGTTFFYFEISLTAWPPLSVVAIRLVLAAAIFWVVILLLDLPLPVAPSDWGRLLVMGFLNHALPWSCMVWALQEINSGTAGIINGTVPLFVLLFAHFLTTDERLSWRKSAAVAIGIGGVCLMIGPGALGTLDPTSIGQLVFLGTSVVLALAAIWGRGLKHMHPLVAAAGSITCAALIAAPAALIIDGMPAAWPPLEAGLAMLGLSVLSTVCAYSLFFVVLQRVGATNLVLVNFLVPVVALSFGTVVLGEDLAATAFLGMGSVFLALALADGRAITWLGSIGDLGSRRPTQKKSAFAPIVRKPTKNKSFLSYHLGNAFRMNADTVQ